MTKQRESSPQTSGRPPAPQAPASRRSVFFILGGLVVVGLAAGYSWLRGLPKD